MVNLPSMPIHLDWMGLVGQTIYWLAIILLSFAIIAVMIGAYYLFTFKFKVTVFPLYGSGKDGVFAFAKPKGNRCKWNKHKTAWKKLWPLFNKEEIEPFDAEYIYPGNRIFVFDLNGIWMPGRINIIQDEEELRGEINPVPYYIRNWQSLQHKKNAIEYASTGFWEENKYLIYGLIAIGISCALCGATIYFTYKFASGGRADISALTEAIKSFGTIGGK